MRPSVLLIVSFIFLNGVLHAKTSPNNFSGTENGASFYQKPLEDSDAV